MKAIYVILTTLCLLCLSTGKSNAAGNFESKIMTGRWEVFVPEAFPGFQYYTLHIREMDNKIVIDIQGVAIDVKEMKFIEKNGKLQADLYINGELSKVLIWEENGVIKGSQEGLPWVFKKL